MCLSARENPRNARKSLRGDLSRSKWVFILCLELCRIQDGAFTKERRTDHTSSFGRQIEDRYAYHISFKIKKSNVCLIGLFGRS